MTCPWPESLFAFRKVWDRLAEQLRHRKSKLVKGTREKSRKAKIQRQVALA